MALSTGTHEPNPQMKPTAATPKGKAPDMSRAEAAAKQAAEAKEAQEAQQKALETGEPWLNADDEGVDWVMLYRCYPNARSKDELRSLAMAAGKEALMAAAEATANVDLPVYMSDDPNKPADAPPAPPPPTPPPSPQPSAHR